MKSLVIPMVALVLAVLWGLSLPALVRWQVRLFHWLNDLPPRPLLYSRLPLDARIVQALAVIQVIILTGFVLAALWGASIYAQHGS